MSSQQLRLPSKVVFIPADSKVAITEELVKPSFDRMQEFIGGYIETFPLKYQGRSATYLCNDNSWHQPVNERVSALIVAEANRRRTSCQKIYGNVIVLIGFKV